VEDKKYRSRKGGRGATEEEGEIVKRPTQKKEAESYLGSKISKEILIFENKLFEDPGLRQTGGKEGDVLQHLAKGQ